MGSGEEAKEALERALIEAWDLVDETIIEACLESLCRRRDAVIAAKGWHTKYYPPPGLFEGGSISTRGSAQGYTALYTAS